MARDGCGHWGWGGGGGGGSMLAHNGSQGGGEEGEAKVLIDWSTLCAEVATFHW